MGELFIFIGMCLLGAFCVIGLIEWVKSVRDTIVAAVKKTGKVSTIAWPILSLVFAVGMGFALGKMPEWSIGPHSKCGKRVTVSRVQIPIFPLFL